MFRTSCEGRLSSKMLTAGLLLILSSVSSEVGRGQEALEISLQSRGVYPGEVVRVHASSGRPVRDLSARALGKTFWFGPEREPETWDGLIGIDLDVKPGNYEVQLEGYFVDGSPISPVRFDLEVQPKEFPTRKLTVDQKYVSPSEEALERIRRESQRVNSILAKTTPGRYWSGEFIVPVPGKASSSFGKRSILNGQPRSPHSGTDFSAGEGTPIESPNAGVIVLVDNLYFAGNTIIVDHGQGLYSYFAHLSEFGVQEGDQVEQGQVIGKVGATGRVTGPHLHWTVRLAGARVDPLSLIEVLKEDSRTATTSH